MTLMTRNGDRSSEELMETLHLEVRRALLIGGVSQNEIQTLVRELKLLQATLQRVRPECIHAKAAAA
jgi:hypothetical protein